MITCYRKIFFIHYSIALFLSASFFPSSTWADATNEKTNTAMKSGNGIIEEVVVTTRRRQESKQDVPIVVNTVSALEIQRQGISDIGDVANTVPGIEFDEGYGAQDTRIVIRGLSPTRGRSNTAFLVDGIDFTGEAISSAGSAFSVNQRLLDIEQVEVVKGPQSALYGRSAFAGAIQYITKKPNMDAFEANINLDANNGNQYEVGIAAGGPITSTFGLRANALWWDEKGFYDNEITGNTLGGGEGGGLALTGLWLPTDRFSLKSRVAYSEDKFAPAAQARIASNTLVNLPVNLIATPDSIGGYFANPNLGQPFYPQCNTSPTNADGTIASCTDTPKLLVTGKPPDADDLSVIYSPDPRTGKDYKGTEVETLNVTFTAEYESDIGTFTSYTGYATTDARQRFDGSWDALPVGSYSSFDSLYSFTLDCDYLDCSPITTDIDFDNETRLFSQELRYATDFSGPLNFTTGLLLWREDVDQIENNISVTSLSLRGVPPFSTFFENAPAAAEIIPQVITSPNYVSRDTDHWSVYLQAEWDISESLKLTLEGRYVEEKTTVAGPVCDPIATENRTGFASTDEGTDTNGDGFIDNRIPDGIIDSCDTDFRGGSATVLAEGPGSQAGQYVQATTVTTGASVRENFFAPKITLEWTPDDSQLWYFSIAKGVKPGGISTILSGQFFDPNNSRYDKEKLIAYELGGKTQWLDNSLQINGAIFFQDYTDKQVAVTQFDTRIQTDISSIENAGESEVAGLEIETLWRATDNLTLSLSYSLIDAEYTKFRGLTSSSVEIARSQYAGKGGCLAVVDNDPAPNDGISDLCVVDRTGNRIEDIPRHSFVAGASYIYPSLIGNFDLLGEVTVRYTDERYVDENNIKELDSYSITNLRIGLIGEKMDLVLYVDNLFDDDTVRSAVDIGSQVNTAVQGYFPPAPTDGMIVSMPDPRMAGIRASYRF